MRLPPLICGAYAGAYAGEQIAEEHMRHIVARPSTSRKKVQFGG
jgi:hypothetical protein